ncbi:hypothetical protein ACHQM5_030218 [Ranunculus cassubicifolius]
MKHGFFALVFILKLFMSNCCTPTEAHKKVINVGVILDLNTGVGKMCNTCISSALEDFYTINHQYLTRLALHPRNAKGLASALFAAVQLLEEEEVQLIVGPQKSGEAGIVGELGKQRHVPIVSFSATNPSISRRRFPYLITMTQNDTYQLMAITSIIKAYGWKEVVLIYEATDFGNEILPCFIDALEDIHVRIRYRSVISPSAMEHQILDELRKLEEIPIRVFIVHLSPSVGSLFFLKVKEFGLMSEGNVWIITEGFTNLLSSMNQSVIFAMRGVIGVKPYISNSDELNPVRVHIRRKLFRESGIYGTLNIVCLHAYDTIWALALAAERAFSNQSTGDPIEYETNTNIGELDVPEMGSRLLKEIFESKFTGLSGEIALVDGELQPLAFQIINIVGEGERRIGFWVPTVGISQQPNGSSEDCLLPVIWPGEAEPTTKPQGWIIPSNVNVKKLKIGYLVKDAFSEFVNVSSDGTFITGYSIEVFKAVVEAVPYIVPYEFIPFESAKDATGGSYNDLVDEVILKKYDAAVGDITITADRSLKVDFSIPYTLGGVAMLVAIKYDRINTMQVLLDDLSWKYMCLPFAWFVLIVVVWTLHQVTRFCIAREVRFLGIFLNSSVLSPSYFLSILTLFTNLIEGVKQVLKIIIHIFVIGCFSIFVFLFLQIWCQENAKLDDIDAKDLVRSGEFVGYRNGSFVGLVLEQLKFDKSQLKVYNTREEYDEALDKGSNNGGVSAIFDEIPYIKGVLENHCGKYRRVGPIYQMKGFGFVFPRGSHLVPEFSRAISLVLEGEKILQIDKRWSWSNRTCPDPSMNIKIVSNKRRLMLSIIVFLLVIILIIVPFVDSRQSHVSNIIKTEGESRTAPQVKLPASSAGQPAIINTPVDPTKQSSTSQHPPAKTATKVDHTPNSTDTKGKKKQKPAESVTKEVKQ